MSYSGFAFGETITVVSEGVENWSDLYYDYKNYKTPQEAILQSVLLILEKNKKLIDGKNRLIQQLLNGIKSCEKDIATIENELKKEKLYDSRKS